MSETIRLVKERYTAWLMSVTGVTGVGSNGTHIIVYIEKKDPKLLAFLPTDLEGIPVKIVVTGAIRPLP